ncbi:MULTISPECIES: 6,7-dimethyl-8-ribityllumazine synthase [Actinopolyspora]|uniref:6,7-dimethyl-8-ribityllumazine synthase n=1 Tax=Actinopolyspora saharensis TaxID=995062 RepID=A0A1H0Y8E1_9ACTN|nr:MULTISPECIES: 6,7-dimethyl-8-ribityllumazine synthase [Actinopolyspora]NHD17583.1 6,7-dimethyl-8-ribityllumazine synthase [Actinopolyspora sp. BKK2]NHE76684.1 6,7-dimethyl-8-ribityllumazine synthase [Actinopolyspora sp. BKK1]SDQ11176.1 6,7-dimethyl-8-ribityllumazine synthase [Actinopolyspora saharensis]
MSGEGRPQVRAPHAPNLRLAIVAIRWHTEIAERMLRRALDAAEEAGIAEPRVVRVPGSMELPVVSQQLTHDHDAVVALGVVIRGGTPHFEYVCESVTSGLGRVALDEATAVGNGVLTVDTRQQAVERAGFADSVEDKGFEATAAALDTALVLSELRGDYSNERGFL